MNADQVVERLQKYEAELSGIYSRFNRTHSGPHIADGDESRLRQIVLELRDLFDDSLGKNTYSKMVVAAFNEGVSNFIGSPSLHCVETIKGIVSAAITRLEANPALVEGRSMASVSPMAAQEELALPDKVTLHWLYKKVPYTFWISLVGLLAAAFALGITMIAKVPLVQQWMGIVCGPVQ